MSVHYCGKCGISAGTDDVFCHRCGMELNVEAAPSTEYAASQLKMCSQCGEPLPMGDRFCGKCGAGLATRGYNAEIHIKRRVSPSGITTHKRRRGFLFKLISALVFWGVTAGALYGIYKFFGSGIPWFEVMALVTGTTPQTGEVTLADAAGEPFVELPPIVPETADSADSPAPDPIREESVQAGPVPPPRPEWGEQDVNGYSVLILPEQNEAGGANVSLRGVVSGNRVNLRAEPNTSSQVLGQLSAGNEVAVSRRYRSGSEEYFWYEVNSGDNDGWMYGQYLRVEEE